MGDFYQAPFLKFVLKSDIELQYHSIMNDTAQQQDLSIFPTAESNSRWQLGLVGTYITHIFKYKTVFFSFQPLLRHISTAWIWETNEPVSTISIRATTIGSPKRSTQCRWFIVPIQVNAHQKKIDQFLATSTWIEHWHGLEREIIYWFEKKWFLWTP